MKNLVENKRHRLSKAEYLQTINSIDRKLFYSVFCENGNKVVCDYFNITLNVMYRLVKDFNIKLTDDQLKYRNKIASEQRLIELYGVKNNFQRADIKEKIKQTNLERYAAENPFQADEIKEKIKKTNNKHLGVDFPSQSLEVKEKIKQNNLEKYGVENVSQLDWVKEKMINTCLDRFGTKYSLQSKEVRVKIKQTNLEKYGVVCVLQSPEIIKNRRAIYILDDQSFDSLPELAVYIFYLDNNKEITRLPIALSYTFESKEHKYFPDFKIDGKLVEIKGDHFFKEDGTMCNPFDHSQDALYEAKHQCMIKNNVEIWTSKKYQEALDYFSTNYDINDFKIIEESKDEF